MRTKKLAVVICLMVILSILSTCLVSCGYNIDKKEGNLEKLDKLPVREDGSFKILQLTDMHLIGNGTNKRDKQTLQWMIDAINETKPDLVELTGDISGNDKISRNKGMVAIANIMEEMKQYWSYTCGNHDGEWEKDSKGKNIWVGRDGERTLVKEVCAQAEYYTDKGDLYYGDNTLGNQDIYNQLTGYEYCLSAQDPLEKQADTRKSMGVGNYVIDLVDAEGNPVYALFHMDSHGKMYLDRKDGGNPVDVGYVGITNRQVQWYADNIKPYAEAGIPSSLWMHIPTYTFREMVEVPNTDDYENGVSEYGIPQFKELPGLKENALDPAFGYMYKKHIDAGVGFLKEEGVYGPRWNDGLIPVMDENRSTNMIAVGHDHNNAFYIKRQFPSAKGSLDKKDDIMLCYGRCSGVNAWGRRVKIGATVYTINTKAQNPEDMYDIEVIFPDFDYVQYFKAAEIDSRNGK